MSIKIEWHTEQRKISELIPYSRNPRKLTDEQRGQLQKSIEKFNLAEIPAINTDNMIIAGHQRLKVMVLLGRGEEYTDVRIPNRKLDVKEIEEYCIRSNKNTGEWDLELLSELDETFLKEVGFDDQEIQNIFQIEDTGVAEEDDYEIPEEIKTDIKKGDIFVLGEHRLMCGDSTDAADVELLMDGCLADVIFTDPPYGVSYRGTNNPYGREWEIIKNDDLRDEGLYRFLEQAFLRYSKYSSHNAAMYVCYASCNHIHFEKAINNAGFRVKQQLIWSKQMVLGHSDYHWAHEPILYCAKHENNCEWYGSRSEKTVFELKEEDLESMKKEELVALITKLRETSTLHEIAKDARKDYVHPTQKPISLPFRFLLNSSLRGMAALDLFGGSGSTLMACEELKRKCYTMELDEKYCQVIIDRWEKYTNKKAVKVSL